VRICEVALGQTGNPQRARAQVSIVVDWKTLIDREPGRLDGEFTGPIHPRDIEMLLCECDISRVVTGPAGLPLDVGQLRMEVDDAGAQHVAASHYRVRDENLAPALQALEELTIEQFEMPLDVRMSSPRSQLSRHVAEGRDAQLLGGQFQFLVP